MCSNFQAITPQQSSFVQELFGCALPNVDWQEEVYPTYAAPFILLAAGQSQCHLAQFGLVPHWAVDKKRFGLKTYNARSETVAEKPSYRSAWRRRQFGLALMQSFYEPCYDSGKAVRWRIRRSDASPMAVASIFEHFIDPATGTALWSFSLLTIHAAQHPVMQHFHRLCHS
jgi:putative SOS response-associated peptidase YedK